MFYGIRKVTSAQTNYLGLIEVFQNGNLGSLFIDRGEVPNPLPDFTANYGPVTLGGFPSTMLTVMFNRFNKATTFQMCSFTDDPGNNCMRLPSDTFSLDPFGLENAKCGSSVSSINQPKLQFICEMSSNGINWWYIVTTGIVSFSTLILCLTCCCFSI